MHNFFTKKVVTPFIALILVVVFAAAGAGITYISISNSGEHAEKTTQQLYQAAVADAVFADENEIEPLVNIDKKDEMVTFNKAGDKVLLLSWHKYPDSYPAGKEISFKWGSVWTFTDKEIASFYQQNKNNVKDWTLRLEQLIGLPPESGYTHFSAFWVDPEDVVRPGYVTDINAPMKNTFDNKDSEPSQDALAYQEWFDDNIINSYFDSAYPWTRLGYTYDWADNGTEYGLSEFLIAKDSKAMVEFTMTTEEFLDWLKNQQ